MNARRILEKAQSEGWALGAFNAANIETLKAIVGAAEKLRAPVIIESSSGETEFFGAENLVDVVRNFREETGLTIFINLDHSPTEEEVSVGLEAGYELIHFDGSKLPYEQNVEITKKIVEQAHAKGLLVEAEIDHIGGSSAPHLEEDAESAQKENAYTDPERAADFVEKTGIDTFAAFFGNVHGVYKNPPKLDLERLRAIREKVPCFLSMHGGSGIPDEDVRRAIEVGKIVKINVNTELRIAYKQAAQEAFAGEEVAAYKVMSPVIEAVQKVVEEKIQLFASAGKA